MLSHCSRQDFDREKAKKAWPEHKLIFCATIGTPLYEGPVHHAWTGATEAAGVPRYRIHDLRDPVASNLIRDGMGLLEVALVLGHANATLVATTYGHVKPAQHSRAAVLVDGRMDSSAAVLS